MSLGERLTILEVDVTKLEDRIAKLEQGARTLILQLAEEIAELRARVFLLEARDNPSKTPVVAPGGTEIPCPPPEVTTGPSGP